MDALRERGRWQQQRPRILVEDIDFTTELCPRGFSIGARHFWLVVHPITARNGNQSDTLRQQGETCVDVHDRK